MRVIIDTNVLVSALLHERSLPYQLIALWRQGRIALITSAEQLEELRRATRYPKIRARLNPSVAGRLVNELKGAATTVEDLPDVSVSRDPWDNYLLAMIEAEKAGYLITGDKADLLSLERHAGAQIVTVRHFLKLITGSDPGI
ncbi:MAG: putative toxin-antitoxin system toxin component, PIN family [Proteobacteria bacterium]|jgi:putative PIN family toxin of toxin-antitoxin system|nr:putative toxin-antitoxin system toxin component, PIN family [Pseudomonadota bacterium]